MRQKHSDYMHWAKTESRARYNLATSGVGPFPMRELGYPLERLEINGGNSYGYPPLNQAIADRHGVDVDCVVTAAGTSMANYLAFATMLDAGDEVLMEHPTYGLLTDAARSVGAEVKPFARTEESGYALDPAEVRRAITPRTKLIVVTNLHNPSSVLTSNAVLREVGDLARSVGARVLVDEVYLDLAFSRQPRSSFHLGPQFVVTSSLTKAYGLSGLRCGWVLAEPELARRMWRLNDLMDASRVHVAERMSVIALDHLEQLAARTRKLLETNRRLLDRFLNLQDENLETVRPEFGTIVFPRLRRGTAADFCKLLRDQFETTVVPGDFFEMPQHFRLGIGGDSKTLEAGLERLAAALDVF